MLEHHYVNEKLMGYRQAQLQERHQKMAESTEKAQNTQTPDRVKKYDDGLMKLTLLFLKRQKGNQHHS